MRKFFRILISIAACSFFSVAALPSSNAQDAGWIDPTTAAAVLPYASMAENAYGNAQLDVQGWQKVEDARALFERARRQDVRAIESSGFSASIYVKKDAIGRIIEVAVAYRGTDFKSIADWRANLQAWQGETPAQYKYAKELTALVQRQYLGVKRITLTGHSLGGALATYAAQQNRGIANVVAFSPARVGIVSSVMPRGTSITNVIIPGEMVADANTKSPAGFVSLPGKIYSVRSTTDKAVASDIKIDPIRNTASAIRELVQPHKMEGTLGGLQAAATKPFEVQETPRPNLSTSPLSSGHSASTPSTIPRPDAKIANSPTSANEAIQRPTSSAPVPNNLPISSPKSQSQVAAMSVPARSTITGFAAPTTIHQPGGVSLSRAASERIPLNIAFDASFFDGQRIVLSGHDNKSGIDAALFLTAMRAACGDRDPYFSLDPDNGTLWSSQGRAASELFWERIKNGHEAKVPTGKRSRTDVGVELQTVSAARDYSDIWREISPRFPDFRAKLVFSPDWLRHTRFGEILYKSDVLLKELSSGVPVLAPGKLRASAIEDYLSADVESVAKLLLTPSQRAAQPQWSGSRLWFDIAPSSPSGFSMPAPTPSTARADPQLRSILASRGLLRREHTELQTASAVVKHGDVYDLSTVRPRMFVRIHDHSTGKDLSDHDPLLDGLATDVSLRFERYAEAYEELRILRDIFRAYVAAVQIVDKSEVLCEQLVELPLLNAEKVDAPLPEYHHSELFVTIGNYWTLSRTERRSYSARSSSMSGGVSIAGRQFASSSTREGETDLTRRINDKLRGGSTPYDSDADGNRRYLTLILDAALLSPVKLAASLPVGRLRGPDSSTVIAAGEYEIENEPPPASMPAFKRDGLPKISRDDSKLVWGALLLLIAIALFYRLRVRTPSRAGR